MPSILGVKSSKPKMITVDHVSHERHWATSLFDLRLSLSLFAEPKLKLNSKVCT